MYKTAKRSRLEGRGVGFWLTQIGVVIGAAAFVFPIYIFINLALKDPADSTSPLIPTIHPTLNNVTESWTQASLGGAMARSAFVTIVATALVIILASLAAWPLARSTKRLSTWTFYLFMLGLLLPFQLGLIPLYLTFRDFSLLGNLWGLVLFYGGIQLPFAIFVYAAFIRGVALDYEEAGRLDGAGPQRLFWSVVFPLLRPVTGTVAILNAVYVWNDFFVPLLFLSGGGNETVPVALYSFVGTYFSSWNLVFGGLLISILPILAIYIFLQDKIIVGFAGGLKG